ncbi:hypothetical protein [Paenibacillus polymyxa]|uniref:hypothetical protein n=1 Tax=Paenibacillus polymyxa TaxID=1406 RepID=UPI0007EB4A61|nr:hypothetical protein [Paenibacillus polymyxa]OAZ49741.1 hypothetical protein A9Z39_10565 [Paenibacillus polymyxa]
MRNELRRLEFILNKKWYFLILSIAVLTGLAGVGLNLIIPKPETFVELCKYLYHFPGRYFGTILVNLLAFASVFLFGLITIINSIQALKGNDFFKKYDSYAYDEYELTLFGKVIFSFLIALGISFIIFCFSQYFYYAALLIGVLLIIAAVVALIIWIWSNLNK